MQDCTSNRYWLKLIVLFVAVTAGISTVLAQTAEQLNQQASGDLIAGRLDAAVSELRSAARRFPNDKHIQFNLGLALVRKGLLEEAIHPLELAARDPALASEAHFALGADYFENKQYDSAIRELRGLETSDHAERVLYMIEESNRRAGHIEKAKAAFHELITRYPESAWTHYLMATAYENQQQPEKAIEEYQRAIQKDPAIPNADFAIGYIYFRQQNNQNAREWLQKETARGCHGLANYYLGEIARLERDWKEAEASYRRSLACDSSNSDAHLRLGIVLGDQKRFREAIIQLRESVRLAPNEPSAHYHLASIYRQIGRTSQAETEYKKVRQIQAAKDNGIDVTGDGKP